MWDKLVIWDSRLFRLKHTDENNFCQCVTCGATDRPQHMQLGHYFDRRHRSVYFETANRAIQCPECNSTMNRPDDSNCESIKEKFKDHIIQKNGIHVFEFLENRHRKAIHWLPGELSEMMEKLKKDVKFLLSEKRLNKWW